MIRYLTLEEVLYLHRIVVEQSGGHLGVRDLDALESAVAQPQMAFGGKELYSTIAEKATSLGFSLISNHPFIDGNKRAGHAAMETFLVLNGMEISASVNEQERVILGVAAGHIQRHEFGKCVHLHAQKRK